MVNLAVPTLLRVLVPDSNTLVPILWVREARF